MSASGSNFIWKITKLAIHSNKKTLQMFERLSHWHLGAFFRLKSFFLNSDSTVKNKRFKKILFFLQFLIFFTN